MSPAVPVGTPGSLRPVTKVVSARYRSLDFWRGLACLFVVISHSTWYVKDTDADGGRVFHALVALANRGWLGVPIFS